GSRRTGCRYRNPQAEGWPQSRRKPAAGGQMEDDSTRKLPRPKAFPGPLWLNRNPDGVLTARSQTPSDPFEHATGERKVNTLYSPLNSPPKRHFGRTLPLPEEGKRSHFER